MTETLPPSDNPDVPAPPAPTPKEIPEARQCQDQESDLFGAIAVRSNANWGVMQPLDMTTGRGGGHWATDDEVKDWKVLS